MANPQVVSIPEWEWVKIATATRKVFVNRLNSTVTYYKTYRLTGKYAPEAPTIGTIPQEAVEIFRDSNEQVIESSEALDVYIMCANHDNDSDESGLILVGPFQESIDIYLQDQISDPLEFYLSRKLATTSLTENIPINTSSSPWQVTETETITVLDPTGFQVGLWVELWDNSLKFQAEIENVSGSDITLAKPIGFPFTTNSILYLVDVDQNKNFTLAGTNPIGHQYYTYEPPMMYGNDTHENRFMITMLHDTASDPALYGDIEALTNGIVFSGKGKRFATETGLADDLVLFNNLFNIKRNEDYKSIAYDVAFDPASGNTSIPGETGKYGTSVRKTFNGQDKSGVVIPVRVLREEATRALFRDDLSSLFLHRIRVIGHRVLP